jgi:hypothetical protein
LNKDSQFELAHRIRRQGAPLGEIFSFISSLYFRGKLAYAKAFGNSPPGLPPMLALTTSRGLLSPEITITLNELIEMSGVPIDLGDSRYREPLVRDARALLTSFRRVPRLFCSAVSQRENMSIHCLKFSDQSCCFPKNS